MLYNFVFKLWLLTLFFKFDVQNNFLIFKALNDILNNQTEEFYLTNEQNNFLTFKSLTSFLTIDMYDIFFNNQVVKQNFNIQIIK